MSEKVDDFIGREFPTPKGGVLTVIGKSTKIKGKVIKYTCECSTCSADKELFPDAFYSAKYNLENGSIPCGCTKGVKWSKEQYMVKVLRLCKERGYLFLGFIGEWKGGRTKLHLHCTIDGDTWDTCNISNFIDGKGCPRCGREFVRVCSMKPDDKVIADFNGTGNFPKGYLFSKNKTKTTNQGKYNYWDCTCPKCSYDKYVINGVCSGVFTSLQCDLRVGSLPCRCSSNYVWTKAQQELRINEICSEEGLTFIGWVNGYKGNNSKFKWICADGHLCERTTVASFLNRGARCDTCSRLDNDFGYYPSRSGETDNLYVMKLVKDDEVFIKIGRSFDTQKRRRRIEQESTYHVTIVNTTQDIHENIFKLEGYLHKLYYGFKHKPNHNFEGYTECFSMETLPQVLIELQNEE